jgi:hypothetical protein
MRSIVDMARRTSEIPVGADLLGHLSRQNTKTVLFMLTSVLAIVYLNVAPLPLLIWIVLTFTDKVRSRGSRPQAAKVA